MAINRLLQTFRIIRRLSILGFCAVMLTGSIKPYLIDEILESGKLVVVTRNSPTTYYQDRNGATGYEYELIKEFANYLDVELELMVVNNLNEAMEALESGAAHIAAAGYTREQTENYPVAYGPSYSTISEQIIYRRKNHKPESLEDLQEGRLMVPKGSRHATTLRRWQKEEVPSLTWRETPDLDATDLLHMVFTKELDYTLVNSNEFKLMQTHMPSLDIAFTLGELQTVAWIMPNLADESLRDETFNFFFKPKTSTLLATLSERFYGHVGKFDYVGAYRFLRQSRNSLPQYQHYFKQAATTYGFDWRMLAAMGYQESHWNPKAKSFTGVRGIMMLTQRTAKEMGIENRLDPKQSILGGTKYLDKIRNRLDESILEPDRTWMAMAAYNVGYGHLQDARKLASDMGKDPNLWREVKTILPLLSQKRYYSKTRYGYARGNEPVNYVQNIRRYYDVLIWKDEQLIAANEPEQAEEDQAVTVIPPLL